MDHPSIGRIVHYVLPEGPNAGDCRPAIIVRTWENLPGPTLVNLQVFTDSGIQGKENDQLPQVMWKTSAKLNNDEHTGGTWHWPERV